MLRLAPVLAGFTRKPALSCAIKTQYASFSTPAQNKVVVSEIIGLLASSSKVPEKQQESDREMDIKALSPRGLEPVVVKDQRGVVRIAKIPAPRDDDEQTSPYTNAPHLSGAKAVDMMKQLKHFQYYPTRVQQWVSYARMPKGKYTEAGYWRNDSNAMIEEVARREKLAEEGRRRQASKEVVEQREQFIRDNPLPPDLVGKYRFGVQPEETVNLNPKLREWLTFRHANNTEVNKYRLDQAMLKWQTKPYDTGSTGVQIAVLTERINYVTAHLNKHRGDVKTKLGLRGLINKRYKLMKYCKRKNVTLYYDLIKDLNIKDMA